ncbi:hypothetical protein JCM3765_004706 [Sporobolomyces pararoseus]
MKHRGSRHSTYSNFLVTKLRELHFSAGLKANRRSTRFKVRGRGVGKRDWGSKRCYDPSSYNQQAVY